MARSGSRRQRGRRFVPDLAPVSVAARESIVARQGRRCYVCGRGDGPLAVHHVTRRRSASNAPGELVGLCHSCHICIEGAKGSPGYGAAIRAAESATEDQMGRPLTQEDREQVRKWVDQAVKPGI